MPPARFSEVFARNLDVSQLKTLEVDEELLEDDVAARLLQLLLVAGPVPDLPTVQTNEKAEAPKTPKSLVRCEAWFPSAAEIWNPPTWPLDQR